MASARIIRCAVTVATRPASSGCSPVNSTTGRKRSAPAANANSSLIPEGPGTARASSIRNTGYSSRSRRTWSSRRAATLVTSHAGRLQDLNH